MAYEVFDIPITSYGMTVDHNGMPWICHWDAARLDSSTGDWSVFFGPPGVMPTPSDALAISPR